MRGLPGRRDFLKQSLVGAAALGWAGGAPGRSALASTGLSDARRRELIDAAHFGAKSLATSRRGMAICSHPLASQEAVEVLRDGGNACDAALTASVAQTVVEPHMTTITGVLSMLYYDAASGETTYVNGSVNAPQAALPGFSPADLVTGRGVAVPGFWAGFEAAHARHGVASRRRVLEPAIRYAREGFEIHPFLWGEIFVMCQTIGLTEQGREIYMPGKALPRPGDLLGAGPGGRHAGGPARRGQRVLLPRFLRARVRRRGDGGRRRAHARRHGGLRGALAGAGARQLPRLRDRRGAAARPRRLAHDRDPEHGRATRPAGHGAADRVGRDALPDGAHRGGGLSRRIEAARSA